MLDEFFPGVEAAHIQFCVSVKEASGSFKKSKFVEIKDFSLVTSMAKAG